ncbi:MAG: carbohydrate ABC transporter permease [Anaerolineales bacterium]|nr:carbohydrate ABC transporter permease [Anaerolineales bacterium]
MARQGFIQAPSQTQLTIRKLRTGVTEFAAHAILLAGAFFAILPLFWMLSAAFKPMREIIQYPPTWIPLEPTLDNFRQVFETVPFFRYFLNSILVSVSCIISVLLTSSLAGYALAKFDFRGNRVVFLFVLATLMIPFQIIMIPLFEIIANVGLVDSILGVILPGLVTAFGIYLMRQYMLSIPGELMDAARIDGASEIRIFFRIILPQCRPVLSALTILTFVENWDSFLWPVVVLHSEEWFTIPVGIAMFSGRNYNQYDLQMAASAIAILPVLVVFLVLQRQFVQGMALTGFK